MVDSELWDGLPDAVLVLDGDTVQSCNLACGALLGQSSAAIVGRTLKELMAPGEPERIELLQERRTAGWPLPQTCRVRFVRADGSEVVADMRVSNVGNRKVLCARDITDVTRAEGLIAKLAELASDSQILAGADALLGVAEPVFRALGWTVAFTEVYADTTETVRVIGKDGDPLADYGKSLLGRRLPLARTPIVAQVAHSGSALFLDDLPRRPAALADAKALVASMEAARVARSAWCPIKSEGRVTHILGVSSPDLSEHDFVAIQLFADQLGAAERLCALRNELVRTERLAAVGEMSAVLAHEVRNPVSVMLNAVTTLRRVAKDENAGALLDILAEEIGRLRRLVDDLLDFANPSAPSLEAVPLPDLVAGALEAAKHDPAFEQRAPSVHVAFPPDLPQVEVDTHLARRVLVNLLVNAFQHVTPKGAVTLGAEPADATVRLSIHNEGPRIDPKLAPRIFEPFVTTLPSGSGLGLAIVRRILASLGGSVALAPEATTDSAGDGDGASSGASGGASSGATFVVTLPIAKPRS